MAQRYAIATLAGLPPGTGQACMAGGRPLALFNVDGHLYAIDAICPHDGGSLAEGAIEGTKVICPWHAAEFDLATGKVLCPPAVEDIRSYPVFLNGDSIEVEL